MAVSGHKAIWGWLPLAALVVAACGPAAADHLPAGAVTLDMPDAVDELAPTVLADSSRLLSGVLVRSRDDVIAPPEGAQILLDACTVAGPGTYIYDFTISGDVLYPYKATLATNRWRGDVGNGSHRTVEIPGPGSHRIVESIADRAMVDWDLHLKRRDVSTRPLGRNQHQTDSSCSLEFGSSSWAPGNTFSAATAPLDLTAPAGTVERLGQAAFADGSSARLEPLAAIYGEAMPFYTRDWFVPREAATLVTVAEELRNDGCLQLTFHYDSYTVVQRSGCVAPTTDAVFETGRYWAAVAGNATWTVTVFAPDRELSIEVAESLEPHYLMRHRPLPLVPQREEQLARAELNGKDLLVTKGKQRCEGDCREPEVWYYVYEVTDSGLVDYANYPNYGCLLAVEDDFVLAVAPKRQRVRADLGNGLEDVPPIESGPRVLLAAPGDVDDVRVVERQTGDEVECVEDAKRDGRGGVENLAGGPDETPEPSEPAVREMRQFECKRLPRDLATYSDAAPLATACVELARRTVTLAAFVPNREVVMPLEGREPVDHLCTVTMESGGAAFRCSNNEAEMAAPELMGAAATVLVPVETDEVVATLMSGQTITVEPLNGLAHLRWKAPLGDLLEMSARTGDEFDVLYSAADNAAALSRLTR